jgi:hypothetical protein
MEKNKNIGKMFRAIGKAPCLEIVIKVGVGGERKDKYDRNRSARRKQESKELADKHAIWDHTVSSGNCEMKVVAEWT